MAPAHANSDVLLQGPPKSAEDWRRLIEAVGPAPLLVAIEDRMGRALKSRHTPEDLLQETLLHAWRDRDKLEWRGLRAFRSWLLSIADHRIRDLADREAATKRGGEVSIRSLHAGPSPGDAVPPELAATTTPSRVATYREQAVSMRRALESLPDDCREVVRLRVFERLPIENIATRLGIGPSAVRHRFRRGVVQYERELNGLLRSTRSRARSALPAADSSSS